MKRKNTILFFKAFVTLNLFQGLMNSLSNPTLN
jgi:hypothetical protein